MLNRTADEIRKFHGDALKKHGGDLRKKPIAAAKSATGGDRALSGIGNKPKLGVRLRTVRGSRTTTVTIVPSPKAAKGPWRWIDEGTQAGMRAKRRSVRPIVGRDQIPEPRRTTSAKYHHPGTSGSNAWFGPVDNELP